MVANIYILHTDIPLPPSPWRMWSKSQQSFISEHGHVAYQLKNNQECSNMVAIIFTRRPPNLRMGSIYQNFFFSEHGNVVSSRYFACRHAPTDTGLGQTSTFFQNMAMLHIKLKAITNVATW